MFESDAGSPLRRALWLDAVDLKLRGCLPHPLAAHARLANVDRGRLVFLVDAPVWHARLRLLTDRLCDGLKGKGYRVFSPRRAGEKSGIVTFDPPPASVRATPPLLQIV